MENNEQQQTMKQFFKENLLFFIISGVIILFSIIVIVATLTSTSKTPVTNNNQQNNTQVSATITYYLPVVDATILKDYSATELQYNSTLNQWEAHKSIDFVASAGSEVRAITAGTVIDLYTNYLEGTVVKIQHENGIISEYGSLSEDVKIAKGDKVASNAVIGYVSASANAEASDGAHLHFTMYDDNGKKIDPAGYLSLSSK